MKVEDGKVGIRRGTKTECLVFARLTELDIRVSLPLGDASRYDAIADIDGELFKIQIKTLSTFNPDDSHEYIRLDARDTCAGKDVDNEYKEHEVDAFVGYHHREEIYLWVPFHEIGKTKNINPNTEDIREFKMSNRIETIRSQSGIEVWN